MVHGVTNAIDATQRAQADLTSASAPPRSVGSEFEAARLAGFAWLRFPASLEARFQQDLAPARLQMLRNSLLLSLLLTNSMLLTDWLMVGDRFADALALRLGLFTPLAIAWYVLLPRLRLAWREQCNVVMSLVTAYITVHLSLASHSELAPPYLVCLLLPLLFNSGVTRVRFWMALSITAMMMALFLGATLSLSNAPTSVMISLALVLVATGVFTLFGIHRHEHEERDNWLMREHEQVLMNELNAGNARLERLSRHDALTGLANRRHVDAFLSQVWARARQGGEELAVLMMDVDHFKPYNDHHGHLQGDACLKAVAQALQRHLRRPEDLVARFGGEEFMAVLPDCSLAEAREVAERIREGVERLRLPHGGAAGVAHVTLSIGVASARPMDADAHRDEAHLIAAADAALYEAKARGRNRVSEAPASALTALTAQRDPPPPRARATEVAERPAPPTDQTPTDHTPSDESWRWMRFADPLEQQFLNDGAAERLRHTRISGLLSLLVFDFFLLADFLMAPDVFDVALQVRLLYFTPPALALVLVTWLGRDWVLRFTPPQLTESLVLISGVMAAACLAYILSLSQSPTSQYYHVGLMVVITYGNIVQRLRFRHAVLFSAIVYAIHIGGVLMVPAFNQQLILPVVALVGATTAFTLMANHAMERDERRRYLLSRRRAQLMGELALVQQQLQSLARMDALTGLHNRRHIQEHLQQAWQRALHDGSELGVVMIDIDHFKAFNDRHGHPAGDRCLAQVADALRACLRQPADAVARFGGEEFIAVLPHTSLAEAREVAERIRQAVQALQIPHTGPDTLGVVTVSVGVAAGTARPGQIEVALVSTADEALYDAKHAGRNRVCTRPFG
nr:diguanylate cyclase [uncultured Aquabacterium sp.]